MPAIRLHPFGGVPGRTPGRLAGRERDASSEEESLGSRLGRAAAREFAKILKWPEYQVCRHEIDERAKLPQLCVRRNIKALIRRGRGYRNLRYPLLKFQRMAVTNIEFVVLRKAA